MFSSKVESQNLKPLSPFVLNEHPASKPLLTSNDTDTKIEEQAVAIFSGMEEAWGQEFVYLPSRSTFPSQPPVQGQFAPNARLEELQKALQGALQDYMGEEASPPFDLPSTPQLSIDENFSSEEESEIEEEGGEIFYSVLGDIQGSGRVPRMAFNPVTSHRGLGQDDLGVVAAPASETDVTKVAKCLIPLVTSITRFGQQLWEHPFFRKQLSQSLGEGDKYAIVGYLLGHHHLPQGAIPLAAHLLCKALVPFFDWVVGGRYQGYFEAVESLDLPDAVKEELRSVGRDFWQGGDEMALLERFYQAAPATEARAHRKLARARGALFERNRERSWQRLGENLDLVREGLNIVFRMVMRELDDRSRFGMDAAFEEDPFAKNGAMMERLLLKNRYPCNSLGDGIYRVVSQAAGKVQAHFHAQFFEDLFSHEAASYHGQTTLLAPLMEEVEVVGDTASDVTSVVVRIVAQFATQLMENFSRSIARNDFGEVLHDLFQTLGRHVLAYFEVRDEIAARREGGVPWQADILMVLSRVQDRQWSLHPYVPPTLDDGVALASDEAYFREQVLPKIKRMLCSEKSIIRELLKVALPSPVNSAKKGEKPNLMTEILCSGLDHVLESLVLPNMVEGLQSFLDPVNLNRSLVETLEKSWLETVKEEAQKGQKRAAELWKKYKQEKREFAGETPTHYRAQAKLCIRRSLELWVNTHVPGVQGLVISTALQLHDLLQATPVVKHILYHLLDVVLNHLGAVLAPTETDPLRAPVYASADLAGKPRDLPEKAMRSLAEIVLDLLKVGSRHMPANTSHLGWGTIAAGKGLAWLAKDWVVGYIQKELMGRLPRSLDFNFPSILYWLLGWLGERLNGEGGMLDQMCGCSRERV